MKSSLICSLLLVF